jgi:pimeloyl-ACP methyl ester carboxylesterase
VHGLGGGAYFFRGLGDRLQPEHRVIAVDLPVASTRSSVASFSMATWVDDLGTFVRERVGRPVVLLGHSMGTMLALEAWAAWPEQIRAMIFVGGIPRVLPRIHERLSERARALAGSQDLAGWGRKVSPGVFSPRTFAARLRRRLRCRASALPARTITTRRRMPWRPFSRASPVGRASKSFLAPDISRFSSSRTPSRPS